MSLISGGHTYFQDKMESVGKAWSQISNVSKLMRIEIDDGIVEYNNKSRYQCLM